MDILHAIDQIQAMLRDLSPVLWSYKENLKKQGFTDEEAFALVRDFQMLLWNNANNNK